MKLRRDYKILRLIFLLVFFSLCFSATPGLVEAAEQKEAIDRGVHDKLVEPSIPDTELRSAEKFWEEADRFVLIGDLQAYGSYSDLEGDDLWGGSFYGLIAPAYKLRDRMMFILMYDGQYDRRRELYSDGYGFRKRTEFQRHAFTPMLRMDFGEGARYSLTPSLNYTATWNKDEGQDDSWSQGLYNYRDEGIGLDFDIRECFGEYGTFVIGAQYYKRRYPNFDVTLTDDSGVEYKDDKNYHGIITRLEYSWIKDAGLSWMTEYTLLYKTLDDKKVVQSNGVLDPSDEQEDYVHELSLRLWYFFEDIAGGLRVGLDLNCRVYDSNQNYLIWYGLAESPQFEVNRNYFDYQSYSIGPNIAYIFEMIPLTASFSYSYETLDYSDRWAKDSNGNLTYDDQWETYHQVVLGLKFELTEKISFLAQWEYLKSRSNNDDEFVYEYDYRVNNLLIGAKYEF